MRPSHLKNGCAPADDAGATVVKFVASMKQHGKSSLLGQRMSEWQGGALYCYNDSVFTPRDFENLSKIGQASKLEKLVTTGRFGLGFNSGEHVVKKDFDTCLSLTFYFPIVNTSQFSIGLMSLRW